MPAFPLLRSISAGKKRRRHPEPSTKTATLSSPIRKRTAKRASASVCAPSPAEREEVAHPDGSADHQQGPPSLPELLPSALQSSQLFRSSLSQDTDLLSTREHANLPHPLKGQIDRPSAALMSESTPPIQEQALIIPSTESEPEPDSTWLTDLLVKQEESPSPVSTALLSLDENSQALPNRTASSLKKQTHRRRSGSALTRRSLEMGLLLSVIMVVTCSALWASGIVPFDTTSPLTASTRQNTATNLRTHPPAGSSLQVPTNRLSALPTAISTASFSPNAAIANSNPHAGNSSSTLEVTYYSANANTANPSSSTNTANPSSSTNTANPSSSTNTANPSFSTNTGRANSSSDCVRK